MIETDARAPSRERTPSPRSATEDSREPRPTDLYTGLKKRARGSAPRATPNSTTTRIPSSSRLLDAHPRALFPRRVDVHGRNVHPTGKGRCPPLQVLSPGIFRFHANIAALGIRQRFEGGVEGVSQTLNRGSDRLDPDSAAANASGKKISQPNGVASPVGARVLLGRVSRARKSRRRSPFAENWRYEHAPPPKRQARGAGFGARTVRARASLGACVYRLVSRDPRARDTSARALRGKPSGEISAPRPRRWRARAPLRFPRAWFRWTVASSPPSPGRLRR